MKSQRSKRSINGSISPGCASCQRRAFLQKLGSTLAAGAAWAVVETYLTGCGNDSSSNNINSAISIPNQPSTNYTFNFSDYPSLSTIGGSINVIVNAGSGTKPMYITRYDSSNCWAVSNSCTHHGVMLNAWDSSANQYLCSEAGAEFNYNGTVKTPPNGGASIQDLAAYQGTIAANSVTFTIP